MAVDPFLANALYSINLAALLLSRRTGPLLPPPEPDADVRAPFVSVIVALYDEDPEDIATTVSSLVEQTYPPSSFEVIFAVEPDDGKVAAALTFQVARLTSRGIRTTVTVSDGTRHTKPHALNAALDSARGEYCAFYDAADEVERDQLAKAVAVMTHGDCDVAQARVLRVRNSVLGRLLLVDTVTWFCRYVPIMLRLTGGFPLSGEGLFLRTKVLREVGGFPDVLTEDALLGLVLTREGKRFALIDSVVVEKAPRMLWAHLRQRMRWSRGYLTCLGALLRTRMTGRKWLAFLLIFLAPLASAVAVLSWTLVGADMVLRWMAGYGWRPAQAVAAGWGLRDAVYVWSLLLLFVGIPTTMWHSWQALKEAGRGYCARYIVLQPVYWAFVGTCSLASLFRGTSVWGKTDRS